MELQIIRNLVKYLPAQDTEETTSEISHNILKITSMEGSLSSNGGRFCDQIEAVLNAEIDFHCPVYGTKFARLDIVSKATGYSVVEADRLCIENFFNNIDLEITFSWYGNRLGCRIDTTQIHAVNLNEFPDCHYKDLFYQLLENRPYNPNYKPEEKSPHDDFCRPFTCCGL